jgi:fengycin family lipopeptide synthetase D
MMVVQNFRGAGKGVENLSYIEYQSPTAKFDMTFYVQEMEEDIYISIEYYTAIFKRDTVARLVGHMKNILVQVAANPGTRLKDLDIVSEQEKQELLYGFNGTGTGYPREKTIGELFAEQVEKVPDGCAVVLEEAHLTYRALACEANRLANYLHGETGVEPDQRVGLLMDRSIDMIIAIMGILVVGCAYVPISVSFPEERIKTMIDDADIRIMVSGKNHIKTLNRLQWECRGLDTFLCMDSRDVHGEVEVEKSGLMSRKLWDYVGETAVDEITGGGWNSSYTGEPIPGEEMDEYGDNILKKLEPLLHKNMRVLEIGTASGISMYRIAPRVGLYYGTDLSDVIIRKNEERIRQEGHDNIKLRTLAGHEIHRLEEKNFDLVILNSVIQCFHGHNYLRNVIRKAVDLMADRGYIFIGDIMDLDLQDDLIADLKAFKQTHREKSCKTKIDWSGELFISRRFLEDLALGCPGISDMEFSGKVYTISNELTRYRYDALIRIDKTGPAGEAKKTKKRHKYQHDRGVLERYHPVKPGVHFSSGNLCYVIYTSGSTGRPKGTLTTHYNVTRVVKNTDYIEFYPGDRVLQLSDYAFDGSVFDIFGALLNGCTLVMATREHIREIAALCQFIRRERISVFLVTTVLFNTMVDIGLEGLAGVRKVLFGGERVSVNHAAKALDFLGKGRILHMYGPTETAVYATWYPIDDVNKNRVTIPIGRPTANTWIYILDSSLKPMPIGITGEIYIGGPGVCRGYMNNPELTNEKLLRGVQGGSFLEKSPPGRRRHYKTGDLGRWLPEGNIEFIGRIDHQVKVRGFRIELGEIESRLLGYPGIDEGIVTAGEDETGSRYLAAYLQTEETIEAAELRDYLSQWLPDFMIPAYFVRLDRLPLGSTGKIDRAKLPDPRKSLSGDFDRPRDELEEKVAAIWSEVLGISKEMIGPGANFFELGGHSLKAVVVTSRIYKELQVKIPLAELFQSPTLRALGEYIRKSVKESFMDIRPGEQKEYYELSFNQKRLWIIQQKDRDNPAYNMAGIMVFHDLLPGDEEALKQTVDKILERHESLRTGFREVNGKPVQYIPGKYPIPFEPLDISHLEAENRQKELKKIIHEFNNTPFNLDEPPLFRSILIKNPGRQRTFLYNMHHIVSDGWSIAVLERDFQRIYRVSRDGGGKAELPDLEVTYKDFAHWRNRRLEDEAIQNKSRTFWEEFIKEELPQLHLPHDFKSGAGETSRPGGAFRFVIPEEVKETLNRISRENHITLFSFMFSIYNIFLSLVSGDKVIVSGVVNAGRDHPALRDMVGFFVNLVICKASVPGEEVFMDFAVHIQQTLLDFFQHQNYPLELVMDEKGIPYPEISASFNMINMGGSENMSLEDPGSSHHDDLLEVKFDIEPIVTEYRNGIEVNVIYNKNRFKAENIEIMMKKYQKLIEFFSREPHKRLNDYKQKFFGGPGGHLQCGIKEYPWRRYIV